jgi:hypothetical protein
MLSETGTMVNVSHQPVLPARAHQGRALPGGMDATNVQGMPSKPISTNHSRMPNTTHLVCCRSVGVETRR